jgi:hypothetical protein
VRPRVWTASPLPHLGGMTSKRCSGSASTTSAKGYTRFFQCEPPGTSKIWRS